MTTTMESSGDDDDRGDSRNGIKRGEAVRRNPMKRDFILAMSMFVAMAVVGTTFGLWYVYTYGPSRVPSVVDSRR